MCFILPALAGVLLARRHRRAGILLVLVSLGALGAVSTPLVSDRMLAALEVPPLTPPEAGQSTADAIVVIGGGLDRESPAYGTDTVGASTLERIRYAAWLHRRTGLPILVSGGRPLDTRLSEAETMRDSLASDFNAPPRWVESDSLNTRQNAERTGALLAGASIHRIYLVTHAWHMPRARRTFEQAGMTVVEAPTGYTSITPAPMAWVPSGQALRLAHVAMREWLGRVWYRLNSKARG